MIQVLVVEIHPRIKELLIKSIENTVDIRAAEEARSREEALYMLQKKSFDVVLLDLSLSGTVDLEIFVRIYNEWPELPILITRICENRDYAILTMRCAASGSLAKVEEVDDLIDTIRTVARERKEIVAQPEKRQPTKPSPNQPHTLAEAYKRLSIREGEVLELVAEGKTCREIAGEMFISPKTVESHITSIGKRLGYSGKGRLREWIDEVH